MIEATSARNHQEQHDELLKEVERLRQEAVLGVKFKEIMEDWQSKSFSEKIPEIPEVFGHKFILRRDHSVHAALSACTLLSY